MSQGLPKAGSAQARTFRICIDASHPSLPGHFPGEPIVPGALLLAEIEERLGETGVRVAGMRRVRFSEPVRPGDAVEVTCRAGAAGEQRFDCRIGGELVVRGSLEIAERADER